jgi:3-hydroxyacyl-CoA dehydrogenase/enoyl-CoA hydratase/carnithine racemase
VRERGGVRFGVIVLDDGRGGTNAIGTDTLHALNDALDAAERAEVDAVAVTGTRRWFASGADLSALTQVREREQARAVIALGQHVFRRLADGTGPTFALISGVATGGGLELALHCDYRVVAESVPALALPECMLGLIPAWGGCHLAANLVGARHAVDLIVRNALSNGKQTKPSKALDIGLVDALLPGAHFQDHALDWAAAVVRGEHEVRRAEPDRGDAWTDPINRARTWVDGRVRGSAPAPYRALDLLQQAQSTSAEEMYAAEVDAGADLVMTEQMRAATYAFELTTSRAASRTSAGRQARSIGCVGIVGAGTMAAQLAALVLRALDVPVVVLARSEDSAQRVRGAVDKTLEQHVRGGGLSPEQADTLRARFTATTDHAGLADADLVLESVAEDLATKQQVLREIADVVGDDCVVATGTSALSVTELAQSVRRPQRVVGLHFFNPVDMLPLLEIVHTTETDDVTRATADAFGHRLGKVVIDVADRPAFVFNRLVLRFFGEVLRLAEEGTPLPTAEAALDPLGLPMSPTQLMTFTGLPLITTVAERLHHVFPDRFPVPESMRRLVDAGKTGFYVHQGGERVVDPEVYALAARPETLVERGAAEIRDIALSALAQEIGLVLDEGVVEDPRDVDLALLVGGNFPFHLGGITPYLDREGISERATGRRFLPPGVASLP